MIHKNPKERKDFLSQFTFLKPHPLLFTVGESQDESPDSVFVYQWRFVGGQGDGSLVPSRGEEGTRELSPLSPGK